MTQRQCIGCHRLRFTRNPWRATRRFGRKKTENFGRYATLNEAAVAHDRGVVRLLGEAWCGTQTMKGKEKQRVERTPPPVCLAGPSLARQLGLNFDVDARFQHPDVARLLEGTRPNPDPRKYSRAGCGTSSVYKEMMARVRRQRERREAAEEDAEEGEDDEGLLDDGNEEQDGMDNGSPDDGSESEGAERMEEPSAKSAPYWPQYPRRKPPMTWELSGLRPSELVPQRLLVWGRDPVPPGLTWLLAGDS